MNDVCDRVWDIPSNKVFDRFWEQVKNKAWCQFRDSVLWPVNGQVNVRAKLYIKDEVLERVKA